MAYFTKEQYSRKREYAAKVSADNEKILMDAGLNEDEIEVLIDLSHTRHKLHCSSNRDELYELYDEVGHQHSVDETLVDKANKIAEKYNLPTMPAQEIPEVCVEDDDEYIADYFGISEEEYENNSDDYYENILLEWEKAKDKTSYDIKVFFHHINKKYGTGFPSATPLDD